MSKFTIDENGIHVVANKHFVSYPDHFNDVCYKVEDTNFWFNNRNEILGSIIKRFSSPCVFADIGGGNGYQIAYLSKALPQNKYLLLEPGYNGCRNAMSRLGGGGAIYNCFVEDFDFIHAKVNAIGLFDVIEHIADDVSFMEKLVNVTPKETVFYIAVPAYQKFWNDTDELSGHYRRYDQKSLIALGKKAGLESLYFTYFFSYMALPYLSLRVLPYCWANGLLKTNL